MSKAAFITLALVVTLFTCSALFPVIQLEGNAMEDTFFSGTYFTVDRGAYQSFFPHRQDVVLCHYPNRQNMLFVARIVGLPGERVAVTYDQALMQQVVLINGQPLQEPYVAPGNNDLLRSMEEVLLGQDEYFVMGDNRNIANDSRSASVGPLTPSDILGRLSPSLWPLDPKKPMME